MKRLLLAALLLGAKTATATNEEVQVAVELSAVSFPREAIDKAARSGCGAGPSSDALLTMWRAGDGRLIQSCSFQARNGEPTVADASTPLHYVREFKVIKLRDAPEYGKGSPDAHAAIPAFTNTTAGFRAEVVARVSADRKVIDLDVEPRLTGLPAWRETAICVVEENGKVKPLRVDLPVVHIQTIKTRLTLENGGIAVFGGLPSEDDTGRTYFILTARVLEPAKAPDRPRP